MNEQGPIVFACWILFEITPGDTKQTTIPLFNYTYFSEVLTLKNQAPNLGELVDLDYYLAIRHT